MTIRRKRYHNYRNYHDPLPYVFVVVSIVLNVALLAAAYYVLTQVVPRLWWCPCGA
jgi:multisubunit Na+/H+ antiporter MnhC subunit